jgi:F0F1-type ATP synthase assembly protein I
MAPATPQRPEIPPYAEGYLWVSRVFTVVLEMVLPGLLGGWLDGRFGTSFLAIIGFVLGFAVGLTHLVQMARAEADRLKRR